MKFQKLNLIIGWITFAIASAVYIATIEPTASFWDCGEFIATGYKLEVGHPPGAPFFMLMTRFFSNFAGGDVTKVAMWANIMSALASGGTILFLFWTITHLGRRLTRKNADELSLGWQIAILGSAFIGSLAYTFSDTFWFSAVEGEVYASSSLLTAFVFWAILKWSDVADEKYSNRWLVLIAYTIGISIGVHLLNLLTIPAIALVYYFKKNSTVTPKGVIVALLVSCVILGGAMWGIIPGVVKLGFFFDRIFVNGFGLGYNSGLLFMIVLLAGLFTWGIIYTQKNNKPVWNTVLLSVAMLLIGYGSYATIVIRSLATPPIDQNDPEDAYSLLSYLNRDQYGSCPLIYGQYYNAPVNLDDPYKHTGKTWVQKDGKYVEGNDKIEYNYNKAMCTIFPRMWSSKQEHVEDYKYWGNIKGRKVKVRNNQGEMETMVKPTFGENLRYFLRYQCGFMYFRYFMWNFVGRQNDIQGDGDNMSGNWISGIKFLDEMRLGPQDNLPSEYANNRATNKYYFLPLILGLIGLFYQLKRDKKNFWVVMALFVLTGLAIVVYLNQYPRQPRERDYAYAGSFYAFAVWIGLGVMAVYEWLNKVTKEVPSAAVATGICLFIPGIMCAQNWDDHDRSNRYICHDVAWNYLQSCEPNAIIFTNGDNDTFPLWYIQEVEGVRTDVRVICLPYLITDWYIDQMKSKYYDSEPVPFSMTHSQYETGTRDQLPVYDKIKDAQELKEVINFIKSDNPQTRLTTNYNETIDYFPTKKLKMTIDKEKVLATGAVKEKDADLIVDEMNWSLTSRYILKNDLMILDLVANANWERPIYFVSVGPGNDTNLRDYFQCEGFAYRLVPIKTKYDMMSVGRIDTDVLYDNMMNKFRWGNMGDPKVYLDENIRRTLQIVKLRNNFGRLAIALQQEGKTDKAQEVIKRCFEVLPVEKVRLTYYDSKFVDALFECNYPQAGEIATDIFNTAYNDLLYYGKLPAPFYASNDSKRQMCMVNAQWILETLQTYQQTELYNKLNAVFTEMYTIYSGGMTPTAVRNLERR
jgi:hypothetical protein